MIILNISVSVSAIFKNLVQKFQLKVEVNDGIRVLFLKENPKVKVVSLIKEISLSVQHIKTLGTLYMVERIKIILILGID